MMKFELRDKLLKALFPIFWRLLVQICPKKTLSLAPYTYQVQLFLFFHSSSLAWFLIPIGTVRPKSKPSANELCQDSRLCFLYIFYSGCFWGITWFSSWNISFRNWLFTDNIKYFYLCLFVWMGAYTLLVTVK